MKSIGTTKLEAFGGLCNFVCCLHKQLPYSTITRQGKFQQDNRLKTCHGVIKRL